MSELSKEQIAHGAAIERRRAINGQPNGYRPISETELQAMKAEALKAQAFKLEIEALEGSKKRREALDLPKVTDEMVAGFGWKKSA